MGQLIEFLFEKRSVVSISLAVFFFAVTLILRYGFGLWWPWGIFMATVFAVGVCYFWPTMLGVTSERVPKSGALGLALMGGMGMLIVGVVTAPQMGRIADRYLHDRLVEQRAETLAVLGNVASQYPLLAAQVQEDTFRDEILSVVNGVADERGEKKVAGVRDVLAEARTGELPPGTTAEALRNAAKNAPKGEEGAAIVKEINGILLPADNCGGRMSFRYVAPFSIIIIIVFGILYLRDRAAGGYRAETLVAEAAGEPQSPEA